MMADYSGIHSEVRYYVPLGQSYEVWNLKLTNCSDRKREINVTGYAEFTNNSNYEQDQVNLQYSQYITRTVFRGDRVRQMIHANLDSLNESDIKAFRKRKFLSKICFLCYMEILQAFPVHWVLPGRLQQYFLRNTAFLP